MNTLRIYRIFHNRRTRRKQQSRRPTPIIGKISLTIGAVLLLGTLTVLLAGSISLARQIDQLPPPGELERLLNPQDGVLLQPTQLMDRSGAILLAELSPAGVERAVLTLAGEEIRSLPLAQLTVAVEDPDFYERSLFDGFWSGTEGQSGITARLVNELLLWQHPEPDQLVVGFISAQLLLEYGHDQVLLWRLNSTDYGSGLFGAETAAQAYFGKSASELNLAEAAVLLAASQSPALNPWDSPAAVLENKDALLTVMRDTGVVKVEDFNQAMKVDIVLTQKPEEGSNGTTAFVEQVLAMLEREIPRKRLEQGGFTIITTLDADLQQQAECSTRVQFDRINNRQSGLAVSMDDCPSAKLLSPLPPSSGSLWEQMQGSVVILDPRSAEVLAYVNRLTDDSSQSALPVEQQPGGLLSPFIALAAFTRGAGPATLRWDIPGDESADLAAWVTADEQFQGPIRTRTALANDDALVFAEWMEELGTDDVLELIRQMGWEPASSIESGASLVFRGGETSLLQTALAYSTFANMGTQTAIENSGPWLVEPAMVLSINETGKEPMVLPSLQPQVRSLLSPALAFLVHDILTDEVSRRLTFGYPSPLSIGRPSAATIGFADQRSQSWTVGYTPERLVVTWVAAPPQAALDYRFSAGLWHALIQYATQPFPAHGWDQPAGIAQAIVCDPSGLLPTDDCPSLVSELFLEGNQPGTADTLYRKLSINRETGRLATVFTPLELIEEQIFLIVPPEAQAWAQSMDLPVPPDSYDAIQLPPPLPDTHITSPGIFTYVSGMVDIIGTASGSGFTNYRIQAGEGLNPQQWIQVGDAGQSRVRDGLLTQWDTTGLEGLYAVRLIVQRGTQEIETATIQVTVDNKPPEMTILAPQPADILQQNPAGEVTFQVRPEDNLGVAAVRWYINGKLAAERTQSPYTAFVALAPGNYLSTIEVIDLAGNATRSEDIFFTVE